MSGCMEREGEGERESATFKYSGQNQASSTAYLYSYLLLAVCKSTMRAPIGAVPMTRAGHFPLSLGRPRITMGQDLYGLSCGLYRMFVKYRACIAPAYNTVLYL